MPTKISSKKDPKKENPIFQESPPEKGIHKQEKPVVKTKKAKSHKAIR